MAAINVKVKTSKVIAALENKLAELTAAQENDKRLQDEYTQATAEREKMIVEIVKTLTPETVRAGYYGHDRVELTYRIDRRDMPQEIQRPHFSKYVTSYNMIPEIQAAIRLLQMTDDETVNASTFKQVSKFL